MDLAASISSAPSGVSFATDSGSSASEAVRNWYALYTFSNHEKRVEELLRIKGVEVFLPLSIAVRRWKNRTTARVKVPLFTGYVFAHITLSERARVLEVPSVLSIVGAAGKPVPLPAHEMEILRAGLHLRRADPCPYLKVGDRARIRSGPLAGLEGVVMRKDDHLRVVLSIDLIRSSIAVHVEADEIEPAGPYVMAGHATTPVQAPSSAIAALEPHDFALK